MSAFTSMVAAPLGQIAPNKPVVVADGQTKSAAFATNGMALVGIAIPSSFEGTTLTFESGDALAGTFSPIYNSAGQVSYTVAASRYIAIDPKDFHGVLFLKLVVSSQTGDSTLEVTLKGL